MADPPAASLACSWRPRQTPGVARRRRSRLRSRHLVKEAGMRNDITRRHLLAGAAGAAALGAAGLPLPARGADPLVVTSYGGSWEKFFRGEIIPPFEKEAKGKVNLAVGLSKDWLANM